MLLHIDHQHVEVVVFKQLHALGRLLDEVESAAEGRPKETAGLLQHLHLLFALEATPLAHFGEQSLVCDLNQGHYNIMPLPCESLLVKWGMLAVLASIKIIIVMQDQELTVYLNSKCFDTCIDTFKHKLLTPTEKECMKVCLRNMRGLYIEYANGRAKYEQSIREATK